MYKYAQHLLFFIILLVATAKSHAQNTVTLVPIGSSSANAYTGFMENKHTFAYAPNLNLLVFGHRGGGVAGGTRNQLHFDYSINGGASWTPQIAIPNPQIDVYNTRYPQMCIYNPDGNTDFANVKVVGTGPATDGLGWKASYLASSDLLGANTNYTFNPFATAIPAAPGFMDYESWSLCNLNSGLGYIAARMDAASTVQTNNNHTIDFWKITPDGAGGFARSIKFTSAPEACPYCDTVSTSYDMAFGPDGNTGYILHSTADLDRRDATEYNIAPTIYKTTDAGETWAKQSSINLNHIYSVLDSTLNTYHGSKSPIITNTRAVVDNLGRCHLFAEISSKISNRSDSSAFFHTGAKARFIQHFIIDGNTVQSNFVYRSNNTSTDFGAIVNGFDEQYQVARSDDGTHIFFTTNQTANSGGTTANYKPNLWVYAYRTSDNKSMPLRNFTANTVADSMVYFPRLSPIVKNITNGHQLPIVIMPVAISSSSGLPDTDPVNFSFLSGINVLESDYTTIFNPITNLLSAPWNSLSALCNIGNIPDCLWIYVDRSDAFEKNIHFSPNPTSGNLNVNLRQLTSAATITVSDVTGRTINTLVNQTGIAQLDLSAQAAGIYFVTVQNAEGRLTAKIAVTK